MSSRPRGLTQGEVAEWFLARGTRVDACLVWPAKGRPQVNYMGNAIPLYRFVWAAQHGVDVLTLPYWVYVCHTCDNDHCFEPTHLFKGNSQSNMRDASKKGRTHLRRGETSPTAKYTDQQVVAVRALSAAGHSTRQIAGVTGISKSHVHSILTGQRRPV